MSHADPKNHASNVEHDRNSAIFLTSLALDIPKQEFKTIQLGIGIGNFLDDNVRPIKTTHRMRLKTFEMTFVLKNEIKGLHISYLICADLVINVYPFKNTKVATIEKMIDSCLLSIYTMYSNSPHFHNISLSIFSYGEGTSRRCCRLFSSFRTQVLVLNPTGLYY